MAKFDSRFDVHPPKDLIFPTDIVYGLSRSNFQKYIDTKDVVMVMFYGAQDMKQREIFARAADETCRLNHAYAAVNCGVEGELCEQEGVWKVPAYKLYSKRKVLNSLSHANDYTNLKVMVEFKK